MVDQSSLYCTEENMGKQIGYLAINGKTYSIIIGSNKIGRDPELCNIVIDSSDISRQHALINTVHENYFTIMDLGSLNKTKLYNESTQTLEPHMPYPLKNGDTILFGTTVALFKSFEDDNDMSATLAYDEPSTPVNVQKLINKSKSLHDEAVVVPESSDVSDKNDSFVGPSKPPKRPLLKNNLQFIKLSSLISSVQPGGSGDKIDQICNLSQESQSSQQELFSKSGDLLPCTDVNKMKSVSKNNDIGTKNIVDPVIKFLMCYETPASVYAEMNTLFKIPLHPPKKAKKKNATKIMKATSNDNKAISKDLDNNYGVDNKNPGIEAKNLSPKSFIISDNHQAVNSFVVDISKTDKKVENNDTDSDTINLNTTKYRDNINRAETIDDTRDSQHKERDKKMGAISESDVDLGSTNSATTNKDPKKITDNAD